VLADDADRPETWSRGGRAVAHGTLWLVVVSTTAALFTGRSGPEALAVGAVSGLLYAGVVYVWTPY
jgi:hypothetical protein